MARRHPPAIVRFGNLGFTPVQQKKLEELSQALFNAFQGDITPHSDSHSQGASDPLQRGGTPRTVRLGGTASGGSGPGYMLGDAQLAAEGDLGDLTDVDLLSTPPSNADVLSFDSGSGLWVPAAPSGGGGGGGGDLAWARYTVTAGSAAWTAMGAALSGKVTAVSLPAKTVVHGVLVKTSTAFSGGTVSALTSTVGVDSVLRAAYLADPNLVFHLGMNESSGNALDDGPNGLHFTDVNTVTSAAGKIGTSRLMAAASSEHFTHADDPLLSFAGKSMWLPVWVWPVTNPGTACIWAKREVGGASRFDWILRAESGTVKLYISDGVGNQSIAGGAITTGQWNLVQMWIDFAGAVIGCKVNGGAAVTAAKTFNLVDSAWTAYIGNEGSGQFWDGRVDDAFLFDRAPSATDLDNFWGLGLGLNDGLDRYNPAYDLMAAVSNTNMSQPYLNNAVLPRCEDYGAAVNLRVAFTAVGDTLNHVTAGSVDVYVLTSTLP